MVSSDQFNSIIIPTSSQFNDSTYDTCGIKIVIKLLHCKYDKIRARTMIVLAYTINFVSDCRVEKAIGYAYIPLVLGNFYHRSRASRHHPSRDYHIEIIIFPRN